MNLPAKKQEEGRGDKNKERNVKNQPIGVTSRPGLLPHPGLDSITILSALGLPFPHGFVFENSHENFPVDHPGLLSCATRLTSEFQLEASELPKDLVLGRVGMGITPWAMGSHKGSLEENAKPNIAARHTPSITNANLSVVHVGPCKIQSPPKKRSKLSITPFHFWQELFVIVVNTEAYIKKGESVRTLTPGARAPRKTAFADDIGWGSGCFSAIVRGLDLRLPTGELRGSECRGGMGKLEQ